MDSEGDQNNIFALREAASKLDGYMNSLKTIDFKDAIDKDIFQKWDLAQEEFVKATTAVVDDLAGCVGEITRYKKGRDKYKEMTRTVRKDYFNYRDIVKRLVAENEDLLLRCQKVMREKQALELELGGTSSTPPPSPPLELFAQDEEIGDDDVFIAADTPLSPEHD